MSSLLELACLVQNYVCQKGKTLPISQGKMLTDKMDELFLKEERKTA